MGTLPPQMLVDLERIVTDKALRAQHGTNAGFDKMVLSLLEALRSNDSGAEWCESALVAAYYELAREHPRYVRYAQRAAESQNYVRRPWEIAGLQSASLQGVRHCTNWRGIPLFKSVFEIAVYPMMLWERKPRTVIEIGAGAGGSALWLCDVLSAFQPSPSIVSFDKERPQVDDARITFVRGDCETIDCDLPASMLEALPHPWFVIEDAHVNVEGVLRHLAPLLQPGDYVIVEDSKRKSTDIQAFVDATGDTVLVDTYYADFFGRNCLTCKDALFVKQ